MAAFDKSKPYAELSPVWRGASYKQNGVYYDANGRVVDVGLTDQVNEQGAAAPTAGLEPQLGADGHLTWGTHRWIRRDWHDQVVSDLHGTIERLTRLLNAAPGSDAKMKEMMDADAKKAALAAEQKVDLPPNPTTAQQEPAEPPREPVIPLISEIPGMDGEEVNNLSRVGLRNVRDLAALDSDAISNFRDQGIAITPALVQQATSMLAAAVPGAVSINDAEPPPASGITKEDLIAWAKKEGPARHWQVIRKAMREHFQAVVTNETDAVFTMIKAGDLRQEDAKRQ